MIKIIFVRNVGECLKIIQPTIDIKFLAYLGEAFGCEQPLNLGNPRILEILLQTEAKRKLNDSVTQPHQSLHKRLQ